MKYELTYNIAMVRNCTSIMVVSNEIYVANQICRYVLVSVSIFTHDGVNNFKYHKIQAVQRWTGEDL